MTTATLQSTFGAARPRPAEIPPTAQRASIPSPVPAAAAHDDLLQLVRFCVVGASGYIVNLCVFALTLALDAQQLVAAAAGFVVAAASNFWWNRHWTFAARGRAADGRACAVQAARFFAVSVVALLFGEALLLALTGLIGLPALAGQAASIAAATPLSFVLNKIWCFRTDAQATSVAPRALAARPNTWLVVPTYNEAENIERFVEQVLPQLAAAAGEHHVLIVDDSSPDGTGEIAERMARENDAVEVLRRPEKDGLGRAYAAGFRRALASGAELVMQMDADLSHDPKHVPALIAASGEADLVLGSRYVAGGGVRDWGLARRLLSRGGSCYARMILGAPVRDLTGGFKCFRRELLERLAPSGFGASGFVFQVEVTYRALQSGARVSEVPILFRDRQVGSSKMSSSIILEALWQVLALRLRRERPALRPAIAPLPRPSV